MPSWRRTDLTPGLYDEPVSEIIAAELGRLGNRVTTHAFGPDDAAGAGLAAFLAEALSLALQTVGKKPQTSLALAHDVLAVLQRHAPKAFPRPRELRLQERWLDSVTDGVAHAPGRPRGSLHTSSLLVNAEGESLAEHLRSEFDSADRIDLLCAFIKLSGFERFRDQLERHCSARGRPFRVLTTTYMGASDALAIERIAALPSTEIKVSYDEHSTRLHAKAWIFHRNNGYSTAYVGSSNLSHAAQTDGLEWNVRVTEQGQPALLAQMVETFGQYWSDPYQFEQFRPGETQQRTRLIRALSPERRLVPVNDSLFDLEAKDYQRPILEELATARARGRHRNLLVAATGTGKTVMAALDYRRLRDAGEIDSLLFIAHRREILEQSRAVFRSALQERNFGELLCDGERPAIGRHVFASISSLSDDGRAVANGLDLAPFQLVIIDEAHHSPAASWVDVLQRVRPRELLGLTGTPERADGLNHEAHFPRPWVGNLRVWNAIPHALVPFRYYMLDVQGVDLRDVAWRSGRYAPEELSGRLVGAAEIFVQRAVKAVADCVARPEKLRAIAFCADVRHAQEVQRRFVEHGVRAQILTGATATLERREARTDLDAGRIQVLCVVDIYNEGVDVPNVNALFFFRPTESATVFLQQLGRGLRRARDKAELVVFDLTGRQHHQFRFDRKLRATLGHTPREVRNFVEHGFGRLPAGCYLHFDEQARKDVLDQIRRSIPSNFKDIATLLQEPAHAELSLDQFLQETDVDLQDIYHAKRTWTDVRAAAHLAHPTLDSAERVALANAVKLTHVGDEVRLGLWERLVRREPVQNEAEQRAANMLFAALYGKKLAGDGSAARLWAQHSTVRADIEELIPVLRRLNAVLPSAHRLEPDVPLVLHARYLGPELSAAFDDRTADGDFRDYYTGVESICDGRYDLLLVTLEKSAATKEHLRYRDFPLSETRFHWQSKARTTIDSRDGRRHLHPRREGVTPLLLVREQSKDGSQTVAFRYLGPVLPASHEGERPITVEWAVSAMPADLVALGRVAA